MKRRTKIIIGVVVAAAVGAGAMALGRGNGEIVEVRVEEVKARDLVATVTASGWIRPFRAVDVQADIMGRITDLWVAEGDSVKKGQLLLRIDPTQYQAAVARAQAGVSEALAREAQANANLLQAERNYDRARALAERDSGLVSQQALEEAEIQVRIQRELLAAARHGVAQARAALHEAEDRLAKTTIRAPIDGVVTRLNVEEGETAIVGTMNNPGSLLLTISDLSVMEAVVHVDETDVPDLELGDSASIQIDAFPRQRFSGRVTRIAHSSVRPPSSVNASLGPSNQSQAVDFEVVITLDSPPTQLRPDLSATAEIVTATRQGVPSIPIIALTVREPGPVEAVQHEDPKAQAAATEAERAVEDIEGVFVVRDGKAIFTPVTVGIAGTEHFEILNGLSIGDSVVAGPYEAIRTLQTGKPVRVIQPTTDRARPEA